MSDDEDQKPRSTLMDSYLYGGDAAKASVAEYARIEESDEINRRRSKSYDASKVLGSGISRTRNTEIERGVRIKYKSVHNLVEDQNTRVTNEKLKLGELNNRLDMLVNAIKSKKSQNDELEAQIKSYKDGMLNSNENGLRKQYTDDLDQAKKELNDVSQLSSLSKIRASRSLYELDTLRDKFEAEVRLQNETREKINYLENQRAESLHEVSFLKDTCESREQEMKEDIERNDRLRDTISELSSRLDGELESRVDLECRIQTMTEQKKFEEEINNLMREELERLFLYHGKNKLFDPEHFYNTELNQIKERIREDFRKLNDYSSQSLREEYEFKYTKTVEEIEIARKNAENQRIFQENEETMTITNLKQEHLENEEMLKNLRLDGFRLSQTLEELRNKLTDHSSNLESEAEKRDIEIAELIELINNLKIEMSTMLSFSKTLDAEVSVYARLLNERFTQFMTTDIVENNDSTTKFSYDKYKESIFGNSSDEESETRRKREQEELRKKQLELEQHQKRLSYLEQEREREREKEKLRKIRENEMEEERRKQREIEENNRLQREIEENQRRQREQEEQRKLRDIEQEERRREQEEMRRQRELEEQERLREMQRRQQDLELEKKRIWELEQKRLHDIEEQERLREQENYNRRIQEEERIRLIRIEEEEIRIRRDEEVERHRKQDEDDRLRQIAYDLEQLRLKEEDDQLRINEQRRLDEQRLLEEYELQQKYHEVEAHRLEQQRIREIEEELQLQRLEEEHRQQKEYEEEEMRLREEDELRRIQIEDQKNREREAELRRLENIIVQEHERKVRENDEKKRQQEDMERIQREIENEQREQDLRKRRQNEIDAEKRRLDEIDLQRRIKEQEDHQKRQRELEEQIRSQKQLEEQRRSWELEQKRLRDLEEQQKQQRDQDEQQRRQRDIEEQQRRVKEEQHRQWETEQIRMREIEETTILKQRRQLELEQSRRAKEQEQERQRRLELEREEREKYILEKLKQEQELIELQRRQKSMIEQREREEYESEYRHRQQEISPQYVQREVKCVDNISMITKRITEEKHKSTEIYEEERIEHIPGINGDTIEKQINIKLHPNDNYHSSQNISESSSGSRQRTDSNHHQSNIVDHCVSSNNGHKHVLIVNTYKPKQNSASISNVHTINSRSQSPPKIRTNYISNSSSNDALSSAVSNRNENSLSPKYAIKHKANRYVSGAIGILETSLNGEYIILENLSSNKNVNLKGWYIHRYVPDQNINLIFKFVNDKMLCCGEKLKILSRSCSTKVRSTSMYESVNKPSNSGVTESFKPKDKFVSDGNEKILIATNIDNWGTYSKFSVTKLINPEGVDKAVLTQSLLRLASSTSNVNIASPRDASPSTNSNNKIQSNNSSYYYNRAISNSNNINKYRTDNENSLKQTIPHHSKPNSYYEQYSPRTQSSETISTKTTKKTESSSSSHITTMTSAPYIVDSNTLPGNVHVTRQF